MSRARILIEHMLALPLALVLFLVGSLAIALMAPSALRDRAIDVQLHDTYYVIAHFHLTWLFGAWALATILVARRHAGVNWLLRVTAGFFVLNVLATLAQSAGQQPPASAGVHRIVRVSFLHAGLEELFVASAVLGLLLGLGGLLLSLVVALQSKPPGRAGS